MDIGPNDFAEYLPSLEEFARRHGYKIELVSYDGDQFYSLTWSTARGRVAHLTFSPRYYDADAARGFVLGVSCSPTRIAITRSNTTGRILGTFASSDDIPLLAERLEEGRTWAESCPEEYEAQPTLWDVLRFVEEGGWQNDTAVVGPGGMDYETGFTKLTESLTSGDLGPKLRVVKALASLGDRRALAPIRRMPPLPGGGDRFLAKYIRQLEDARGLPVNDITASSN